MSKLGSKAKRISFYASNATPFTVLVLAFAFHHHWLFQECNTSSVYCVEEVLGPGLARTVVIIWFPLALLGVGTAAVGSYLAFRGRSRHWRSTVFSAVLSAIVTYALMYIYVRSAIAPVGG